MHLAHCEIQQSAGRSHTAYTDPRVFYQNPHPQNQTSLKSPPISLPHRVAHNYLQ